MPDSLAIAQAEIPGVPSATRPKRGPIQLPKVVALQLLTLVIICAAWEGAGRALNFFFLPPPSEVLVALWQITLEGTLWAELVVSLSALVVGLALSVSSALIVGTLMGLFPKVRYALDIYVDAM